MATEIGVKVLIIMAISKETRKWIVICCGLLILLAIIGAFIGSWESIAKNLPGILWGIIFSILLVGILYEGWKAVKPDVRNKQDEVTYWKERGCSQFKQGNFESAISFYNKGLDLDPTNIDILYNKALALDKLGKTEEAMECYETIRNIKENPATENIEIPPKKEGQKSIIQKPVILAAILVVIILTSVLAISQFTGSLTPFPAPIIIPSAVAADTMFRANAEHSGVFDNGGTVPTNTELWRFKTGGKYFTSGYSMYSSPAVSNGVVYFGSDDSNLYAIDALKGKEKWRFQTGGTVDSSPAVSNGIVYVGSHDSNLYAIDALTGKEKWRFKTGNSVSSSPAVSNGVVYVGGGDTNLYAIDAVTGKEKWRFQMGSWVSSSPAVSNGIVYVGSHDSNLYAIDALTGKEKWQFRTRGVVDSSPAVSNGVVYVGSYTNNLYAIDALTGKEKWQFKTGGTVWSSPAVSNGIVYVGSYDNNLYAIDALAGKQIWQFPTAGGGVSSSPAVSNGVVYVGGGDTNLYAIDAVTGKEKWRFQTGGIVDSSPAVSNGVVYVGSLDNNLYAIGGVSSTSITTSPSTLATTITMPVPTGSQGYKAGVKAPKIEFTVTSTDGIAPHTVTVYPIFNSVGGAPQYIVLDFGDGQQLNDTLKTSYTHTYPIAGSYSITLTSVNAGGSNVETMKSPVIVRNPDIVTRPAPNNPSTGGQGSAKTTLEASYAGAGQYISASNPTCFYPNMTHADFRATPIEGPAPLQVNFYDNSSCAPPVAWQWDFGSSVNPGIKTLRDPVMTYTEPGIYNVTLRVINSYNNNSTKTITGFIHVLPSETPTHLPGWE